MTGKVPIAAGTILLAGTFATVLVATLLAHVPDVLETPLVDADPSWPVRAVPLAETAGPAPPVYVLSLGFSDPNTLLQSTALTISFSTSDTTPIPVTATLAVAGTSCAFGTSPDAKLASNGRLVFTPEHGCRRVQGSPQGELQLTVTLARRARLSIWASQPPPGTRVPGAIATSTIPGWAYEGPPLVIDAKYVTRLADTRTRRIDLLGFVWQISDSVRWIWVALAVAIALLAIGVALVVTAGSPEVARSSRVQASLRGAAGVGLVAGALGLLYAVLVPPLQAPDEIDHLLAYGALTGNRSLPSEAADWARRAHFERIKFRAEERFRPIDRTSPFSLAWASHVEAENVSARSPTTAAWWKWLAHGIRRESVPETLFAIRLANVLVFAGAVALGAIVLAWSAPNDVRFPELLSVFALFVPTLPFFAMHVSETALATSIDIVFACSTLALFLDGRRTSSVGLPIGAAIGLVLCSTRSALPMMPFIVAVLAARAILGSREAREPAARWRAALRFWLGLAIGGGSVIAAIGPHFAAEVEANLRALDAAALVAWLQPPIAHPWASFFTLVATGFALELGCGRLRHSASGALMANWCRRQVRWMSWTVAILIACSMLMSLLIGFPHVIVEGSSSSSRAYLMRVLATAATSFRLRDQDFAMSSSFWAGFGWLETVPGGIFVSLLVLLTGVALIALLVRLGSDADLRRFSWLTIASIGAFATVAAYAFATFPMQAKLHGRYLIGLYVCFLAIWFSTLARAAPESSETSRSRRHALTLAVIGGAHSYCLWFILVRYF